MRPARTPGGIVIVGAVVAVFFRYLVQRHGGQIEVESKVGRGTVFHLRLPRQAGKR